jgi:hypothetical protein
MWRGRCTSMHHGYRGRAAIARPDQARAAGFLAYAAGPDILPPPCVAGGGENRHEPLRQVLRLCTANIDPCCHQHPALFARRDASKQNRQCAILSSTSKSTRSARASNKASSLPYSRLMVESDSPASWAIMYIDISASACRPINAQGRHRQSVSARWLWTYLFFQG